MLGLGIAGIGVVLTVASFAAYFLGTFQNARVWGILFGPILMGASGRIFTWLAGLIGWAGQFGSTITSTLFGVAVPGLLAILLAFYVAHGLHPKQRAGKGHFWAALILGVAIAAGITNVALLNNIHSVVQQGVSQTGL
jgi:hypothetical protein